MSVAGTGNGPLTALLEKFQATTNNQASLKIESLSVNTTNGQGNTGGSIIDLLIARIRSSQPNPSGINSIDQRIGDYRGRLRNNCRHPREVAPQPAPAPAPAAPPKKKKKGLFGKIGGFFKSVGKAIGKALPMVATVASFIPGLNAIAIPLKIATAAIGAVKGIKSGNILGALGSVAGAFTGGAAGIFGKAAGAVSNVAGWVQKGVSAFGALKSGNIMGAVSSFAGAFTGKAGDIFNKVSEWGGRAVNLFSAIKNKSWGSALETLGSFGSSIKGGFGSFLSKASEWGSKALNTFNSFRSGNILGGLNSFGSMLSGRASAAFNSAKESFNSFISKGQEWLNGIGSSFGLDLGNKALDFFKKFLTGSA